MANFDEVKDSGDRTQFSSGSVRDARGGKGNYYLLPPRAMRRLAKHFENGAKKYGPNNWQKGMPISVFMDSAMRHTFGYLEGLQDEDHLAAAAWNILCAIEILERIEEGSISDEFMDVQFFTKDQSDSNKSNK